MQRHYHLLAAIGLAALLAPSLASAQVPNAQPPYNTPMVSQLAQAARNATTVYGTTQTAIDKNGVQCRLHQNFAGSSSGSPSTTFGLQTYDAVSQTWLQTAVSGAVTSASDTDIYVYPGAMSSSVPANTTVWGLPIPNAWRVFMTVAGTGAPKITSGVNCGYLR
jgi:hypothetical protein